MLRALLRYAPGLPKRSALTIGDAFIVIGTAALLYPGVRLALHAPRYVTGPEISLEYYALPWYAFLSVCRMLLAYLLSLLFSLSYGYVAARRHSAERVLMPLLDVLQSVPILSFLPVVLLSFMAILPQGLAPELAAIVLIFTSQAWNMTFSFYQSLTTMPVDLREAAAIFRLNPWLRLRIAELPFSALGLVWNSIMSWSGGWFFLMAAEIYNVGSRDFRLPGLGSYLQTAAGAGNMTAVIAGILTLIFVIILLDQLVWRPLLVWADKFKVETVQGDRPPRSWFYDLLLRSYTWEKFVRPLLNKALARMDSFCQHRFNRLPAEISAPKLEKKKSWALLGIGIVASLLGTYWAYRAVGLLAQLPLSSWRAIGVGLLSTLIRVTVALAVSLIWTIPVGVVIGTNRKIADFLQPVVQVAAAVPATALFPVMLLFLLHAPGGLNLVATLVMLMGSQWYLLFNVIAGASAIPQDLRSTTDLLRLSKLDRWRVLILPALFPYIITGAITASGGAWNASIVAEHVVFGNKSYAANGIGSLIAQATGSADYPLLLGSTLCLVAVVVLLNRRIWRRLYLLGEEKYRME
jgi:NitT/TauT family transport system permease protein